MRLLAVVGLQLVLAGCSIAPNRYASWDEPAEVPPLPTKASFNVSKRGAFDDTLFVVATSGGGSRAAVFAANVLLRLQETKVGEGDADSNLLAEVDAISAVSGGALPAAYYAIARDGKTRCQVDGPDNRPLWRADVVRAKMTKNFEQRWFFRWLIPSNVIHFWFTSFDRSDIMSQVLAEALFDRGFAQSYTFADICDDRPNIIINATNGTQYLCDQGGEPCPKSPTGESFGDVFTFTDGEFEKLGASLSSYPIAKAAMASAAFPAVFNYTTLRNYKRQEQLNIPYAYMHLFDGGSNDNLGLDSAWKLIDQNKEKFNRVVVLLVDAYLRPRGVREDVPEARGGFDYFLDTNFLDSVDVLMTRNRENLLRDLEGKLRKLEEDGEAKTFLYQVALDEVPDASLGKTIQAIDTRFKIEPEQAEALKEAVDLLLSDENLCYSSLKAVVEGREPASHKCTMLHNPTTTGDQVLGEARQGG